MLIHCIQTIGIALATSIVGEIIRYYALYSREDYANIRALIIKQSISVDNKQKSNDNTPRIKKRIEIEMERLRQYHKDLSKIKYKVTIGTVIMFMFFMGYFHQYFDGIVLAKLPFEPIPPISYFTHKGLAGDDVTDCSFPFFYLFCTISIRQHVQKICGVWPPRTLARQLNF
uniref:Calcium load-activated calcium channel n=1 Tax=Parastrongyloides trichosuri TaxID=131310 RepID=A0A0N4ZX66_PARTI